MSDSRRGATLSSDCSETASRKRGYFGYGMATLSLVWLGGEWSDWPWHTWVMQAGEQ